MVGLPGQDPASLARDIRIFRKLELDMVGVGPFIPNPDTPMGAGGTTPDGVLALKVLALTRIVLPLANIPAVTSLQSLSPREGLARALAAGANVIMPNLTPPRYIRRYRIYPGKPLPHGTPAERYIELARELAALGRRPGRGRGDSASFLRKRRGKVESP
jgi:biotin synthase